MELFEELIKVKAFPEDTIANGDWGPYWALFTSGKAAISWAWGGMIADGLQDVDFEWELIEQPRVDETGYDTSRDLYSYCGAGIMINKQSFNDPKKQAAIIDFVEFYFSEDMQQLMLYSNGVVPTRRDISYDASKLNPLFMQVMEFVKGREPFLTHLSTIPDSSVWVDYQSGLDEFLAGNMTAEQFIKYVQDSMDKNKPKEQI